MMVINCGKQHPREALYPLFSKRLMIFVSGAKTIQLLLDHLKQQKSSGTWDERLRVPMIEVLGYGLCADGDNGGFRLACLDSKLCAEIEEKVKAVLEPIGLWSKLDFGLYAISYCSY